VGLQVVQVRQDHVGLLGLGDQLVREEPLVQRGLPVPVGHWAREELRVVSVQEAQSGVEGHLVQRWVSLGAWVHGALAGRRVQSVAEAPQAQLWGYRGRGALWDREARLDRGERRGLEALEELAVRRVLLGV
jgi:hypothetical protein